MGWFQHRWPGTLGVSEPCIASLRLGCILECYAYMCVTNWRCTHGLIKPSCCLLTLLPTCLSCSTFLSPRGIMMIALIAYWIAQYFGYIK